MSMEGKGTGYGFARDDVLIGCVCEGEAAPLLDVSMLRSREGVNIGCDHEVSNEWLSAEVMGGRSGHGKKRPL